MSDLCIYGCTQCHTEIDRSGKAIYAHQLSELLEEYIEDRLQVTYPHSDEVEYTKPLTLDGFSRWLKEYK